MSRDDQDKAVRRAINAHEYWKAQWATDARAFSVEMVSPRGKRMTYNAYCSEVNKHLGKTVEKIRKALGVLEQPQ